MASDHPGGCAHDVECETCGAPRTAGLAACTYCKTAYPGINGGVRCPRCAEVNLRQNPACMSCQSPLVQGCVFCGAQSPLDARQCTRCREAFAGAAERKRLRDESQHQQQLINVASQGIGAIASIAAVAVGEHHAHGHQDGGLLHALGDLLGAATGAADAPAHHHHHHSHHHGGHHDD